MRELLHQDYLVLESELNAAVEKQEYLKFSLLKPEFGQDGNQWYVLYGEDLQSGIAGFGDTLYLAILDWNSQFHKTLKPKPCQTQS